jgi:hypothetical protein
MFLISFVAYQKYTEYSSLKFIDSYDSCITTKGSLIQESYPATCITKSGIQFTQNLDTEQLLNLIPPVSTENWKTHNTRQYSFIYPNNSIINIFSSNEIMINDVDGIHKYRINIFTKPDSTTLSEYIYNDGVGSSYGKMYQINDDSNFTYELLSDYDNYKIWLPSNNWPSANGIYLKFIEYGNKIAWLSIEPFDFDPDQIFASSLAIATYNQIFSSFKFTN